MGEARRRAQEQALRLAELVRLAMADAHRQEELARRAQSEARRQEELARLRAAEADALRARNERLQRALDAATARLQQEIREPEETRAELLDRLAALLPSVVWPSRSTRNTASCG